MEEAGTCEIQVLDKGIHCVGCEVRIQKVLGGLPGVIEVKADHKTQKVQAMLHPGKISVVQVIARLEDLGYRTTS